MKSESVPSPSGGEIENSKENRKTGTTRRDFLKFTGRAALGATAAAGAFKKLEKAAEAVGGESREEIENYYDNWLEFKRVLDGGEIKEQIAYVKDKFGPAAEAVVLKPAFDLQFAEHMLKKEAQGEDLRKSESGIKFLREIATTYQRFWDPKSIDARLGEREKREGLSAKITGFKNMVGWSDDEVRRALEEKFNKRWLYGNIGAFQYINRHETQAHYRVAGRAAGQGIQSVLTKGEKQKVEIYRPEERLRDESLLRIMAHEIGHHQDWENNNRLPIQERLQFLREVTARFESGNRLKSRYVDEDVPKEYADKKSDPKEMLYRQVREYWASVAGIYTTNPEELRRFHPEDYLLVKEWYGRIIQD